jgi:hypothetical protein
VTIDEWQILAQRISDLWPPPMTQGSIGAYFDELEPFTFDQVRQAISALAKTTTQKGRPSVGAIYDICLGQESRRRELPQMQQAKDRDPLDSSQHRIALNEMRRYQTPEHARRAAAVMATGKRFTMDQLRQLLPEKSCGAEEFDRRLTEWAPAAPVNSRPEPEPAGRRHSLFGTDPQEPL